MADREWDGRAIGFAAKGLGGLFDRRSHRLDLTEDAARKLALSLSRLEQTTFSLQPEVKEVLDAINYVLVADPVSVATHKRMEAGKGMTPDGGR